jgi:hypothetical protein
VPEDLDQLRAEYRAVASDEGVLARALEFVDEYEERHKEGVPAYVEELIKDPRATLRMVEVVYTMNWRLFITTGPQFFLTSDNPSFFTRGCGLMNPDSEFFLPLSPTHLLHATRSEPVRGVPPYALSQRFVREANKRTAVMSEQFIFAHAPAPWLGLVLARKDNPTDFVPDWKEPKRRL